MQPIFITGGTGYMGKRLIAALLAESYPEAKLPTGAIPVIADAFAAKSSQDEMRAFNICSIAWCSPPGAKEKELFKNIDLAPAEASAIAAKHAGVKHFVYISVAQTPAKIMQDYQQSRAVGEEAIINAGLSA